MKTLPLLLFFTLLQFSTFAQTPSSPVIRDYGIIYDLENVARPDPTKVYKILVDLKTSSLRDPGQLNSGLDNVARMLNLHVTGGVPKENLKVVVAIHGGAAGIVLDNEGYQEKFRKDNPNLDLISQLKKAGVELYVCGQSLQVRGYDRKNVNNEIEVALSMLTIATEKMMDGYGILVFN